MRRGTPSFNLSFRTERSGVRNLKVLHCETTSPPSPLSTWRGGVQSIINLIVYEHSLYFMASANEAFQALGSENGTQHSATAGLPAHTRFWF